MKILASSRQNLTYEDYEASGKFTPEQLDSIKYAFQCKLTPKQISLLANPEFTPDQMAIILYWLSENIPIRQMALIANPELSSTQMEALAQYAIRPNMSEETLTKMASPEMSSIKMAAIAYAASNYFSDEQCNQMLDLIDKYNITNYDMVYVLGHIIHYNLDDRQIDLLFTRGLSRNQCYEVISAFHNHIPYDDVAFFAKPEISDDSMWAIYDALYKGVSAKEIYDEFHDAYDPEAIDAYLYEIGINMSDDDEDYM